MQPRISSLMNQVPILICPIHVQGGEYNLGDLGEQNSVSLACIWTFTDGFLDTCSGDRDH